jgi:hypothetical protein
MKIRPVLIYAVALFSLCCRCLPQATAAVISVGPYTPSTTTPFVVPINVTGAVNATSWQFDVSYNANDIHINTNCIPSSDPFCGPLTGPVTEGPFFGNLSPFNVFNPGFIALDHVTHAQVGQLIAINDAFGGSLPGPAGDGILAYVEFVTTATGTGTSPITVHNVFVESSVPEPGTLALVLSGLALLGAGRLIRQAACI